MGDQKRRVDTRSYGAAAEDIAADYLQARGYRIRARNVGCRLGELDLVAERDGTLCFVEVRMRSYASWGDPAQTVGFSKQRKVVKAALQYLSRNPAGRRMLRFDVVSIVGQGPHSSVEHIPNAFDAGF